MKRIFNFLLSVFLITVPCLSRADDALLLSELSNKSTTDARRDEVLSLLSARPLADIGPSVAKAYLSYQAMGSYYKPQTDKPWLEPYASSDSKIYFALDAVWKNIVDHADKAAAAKQLFQLARNMQTFKDERVIYLQAISRSLWDKSLVDGLVNIAGSMDEPAEVRYAAAQTLITHDDLNRHFSYFVQACEYMPNAAEAFLQGTNLGNRLREMDDVNRRAFLDFGFYRLKSLNDGKTGAGYLLARHLGFLLEAPNEFAPEDQTKLEFQGKEGKTGPNEFYFQMTVETAIQWYQLNRNKVRY